MLSLSCGLEQDITLRQYHRLECSCCGQDMAKDFMREGPLIVLLEKMQGEKVRYHLCPTCFQTVSPALWSTSYKRKWTTRVKKLIAENAKIDFGPNVHVFCMPEELKWKPSQKDTTNAQACADLMAKLKGTNWQI